MQVILTQRRTTSGTQCRPSRIGNRRCYIQSAYQLPTPEKVAQEKASLLERDVVKPVRDEHGILTMSVYDFLLDPDSLTM